MDNNLFNEHRKQFIETKKKEMDYLATIQMPQFKKTNFSCCDIDVEGKYLKDIVNTLPITKNCRVLYYLQIESANTAEEIIKLVTKEKNKKRNKVKLPLVNKNHLDSRILYVGKTNTNFPARLNHHVSLKSAATYALHLEYWAKDISLELSLHFAQVELHNNSIQYLELLESILHESLRPILGRAGH